MFGLRPTTLTGLYAHSVFLQNCCLVGKSQGLELISDLMVLLGSGGFFRNCGLNSLPSIRHIGSIFNDPNIFANFKVKTQTVASFVRKSKFLEQT